jgi:hypothetical protein
LDANTSQLQTVEEVPADASTLPTRKRRSEPEQTPQPPPRSEALAADPPEKVAASNPRRLQRLDFALLAIVLAITFFIRVWDLRNVPTNVMPDEADYLAFMSRAFYGVGPSFFEFHFEQSQTASNLYMQAGFVALFGLDNAIVGIRMLTVVMSTLSIIPFFLLMHRAFGRWTALFTTLLFSSGWWYLNLSRTAWINTFVVFEGLMSLWLITLALRASGRRALFLYALAGFFASLCLYGYAAGKVITLALGLYIGIELLIALWGWWRERANRRKGVLSARSQPQQLVGADPTAEGELAPPGWLRPPARPILVLAGGILFTAVTIVVFLPQVPAILNNWNNYIDRPRAVSITNVPLPYEGATTMQEVYLRQIKTTFEGFVLMRGLELLPPGVQVRYNPPGEPFLDPITRALYIAGLLLSFLTFRRSIPWWLMWGLGLAVTQVLTVGIPDGARAVVIIPSVYFFVGCSIYWLLRAVSFLSSLIANRRRPAEQESTAESTSETPQDTVRRRRRERGRLARTLAAARPDAIVRRTGLALAAVVCAGLVVYNVRHYWDWMHMPFTSEARQPAVEVDEFEEWYYRQRQFAKTASYSFTVGDWHNMRREEPNGLVVSYYNTPDWSGWLGSAEWLRRGAPAALVADSPITGPQPFSVRWKGYLRVPLTGDYTFGCSSDGDCKLRIDGFEILHTTKARGAESTLRLTQGPHPIEIYYSHRNAEIGPSFNFTWRGPSIANGPVPLEYLAPSKLTATQ